MSTPQDEQSSSPLDETIHQLLLRNKLFYRRGRWRKLFPRPSGEVNGLPTSRGLAIATDGLLVLIERGDGTLFEGHLEWFKKDLEEHMRKERDVSHALSLVEDLI